MSHASSIPEVSREDFDNILDDFLEKYEVVGSKYRPALGGTGLTGVEKLAVLRAAVDDEVEGLGKEENTRRILEFERMERGVKAPKERRERVKDEGNDEEKWDVESILCMSPFNTFLGEADRKQRIRIQRTTLELLGQKQQQRSEDRWNGQHVLKLRLLSLNQW
jgi:hypothetical protein